jgi:hypothetical protein
MLQFITPPLLELFIVHEPCSSNVHDYITKKLNGSYDKARMFQDSWVVKFLWAESLGEDSMVSKVRCMICSIVEGKDKLL